ncbi:hypothetical protein IKE67_08240 [bacterium]|nr:hypothetical protein [bacterium]
MQKSFLIIFTIVFLISVFVPCVIANSEIIVEKNGSFTNYYSKQDPIRYAQEIVKMSDIDKENLYKYTMENHDKIKPITYVALADYIFQKSKEDALFWYFVGRIRSTEDVSMCTDKSNLQQIAYYPMLAEKTMEYFAKQDKSFSVNIMKRALEWDETHPDRINPKWACYHGMEVFITGDVTIKPMSEYNKVQKDLRKNIRKTMY